MKKFFIVNANQVESLLPKMAEAYGHNQVEARLSLDGTLALMEFDTDNMPNGINAEDGIDEESIHAVLDNSTWTDSPSGQNDVEV